MGLGRAEREQGKGLPERVIKSVWKCFGAWLSWILLLPTFFLPFLFRSPCLFDFRRLPPPPTTTLLPFTPPFLPLPGRLPISVDW